MEGLAGLGSRCRQEAANHDRVHANSLAQRGLCHVVFAHKRCDLLANSVTVFKHSSGIFWQHNRINFGHQFLCGSLAELGSSGGRCSNGSRDTETGQRAHSRDSNCRGDQFFLLLGNLGLLPLFLTMLLKKLGRIPVGGILRAIPWSCEDERDTMGSIKAGMFGPTMHLSTS